jgi:hypothetical protein
VCGWSRWQGVDSKEKLCLKPIKNRFLFGIIVPTMTGMNQLTTPSTVSAAPLKVSVWRGRADGEFTQYEVPRLASQTVLDVISYIQKHLEPSLGYRFACRVGMCGSCAMTVNGKARWTCRTHVAKVVDAQGTIEVAPLANLPVIKDLVTDMTISPRWRQPRRSVSQPTPLSNVSVAPCVTPPAMWWAGGLTTWVQRR